jgi:hypothetical protein
MQTTLPPPQMNRERRQWTAQEDEFLRMAVNRGKSPFSITFVVYMRRNLVQRNQVTPLPQNGTRSPSMYRTAPTRIAENVGTLR